MVIRITKHPFICGRNMEFHILRIHALYDKRTITFMPVDVKTGFNVHELDAFDTTFIDIHQTVSSFLKTHFLLSGYFSIFRISFDTT